MLSDYFQQAGEDQPDRSAALAEELSVLLVLALLRQPHAAQKLVHRQPAVRTFVHRVAATIVAHVFTPRHRILPHTKLAMVLASHPATCLQGPSKRVREASCC